MFDDIKCDAALPDDRLPVGSWFQTKSLYCCMDQFTITADGRLIFHKRKLESAGEKEVRPGVFWPESKLVHVADIDLEYHGDISFGGSAQEKKFVEYVARFTHGKLEWIRPYEEIAETHKTWFYAKD